MVAYATTLLAALWQLVRAARRQMDPAARLLTAAVLAAAVGHVTTDLFMSAEVTGSWLFWLMLGSALAATASSPGRR